MSKSDDEIDNLARQIVKNPFSVVKPRWPTKKSAKHTLLTLTYPFEDKVVKDAILTHLNKGYPIETCFAALGVQKRTWLEWERRGNSGEEPFASFLHEVRTARAHGQI